MLVNIVIHSLISQKNVIDSINNQTRKFGIYSEVINQIIQLTNLGNNLKNDKFKDLEILTLYYPGTLGYDADRIKAEKVICEALMNMPKFKQLKIISDALTSKDGFASLGNRLTVTVSKDWDEKESW